METHLAFSIDRRALRGRIFIPKFYDPDLKGSTKLAEKDYDLMSLESLLLPGQRGSRLGDWIRREWYGTGTIPYVRTSDLAHWRIRPDFKKGISEEIYNRLAPLQDVKPGDLLMVAHGTYLVGTVAIVTDEEPRLLLQDHVFRLRSNPATRIDPLYLLAALSTAFVKRQVRARQFSADIIDKIGERHLSIMIPIHKEKRVRNEVVDAVRRVISDQSSTRREIREATGIQQGMTRERAEARHGFRVNRLTIVERILIPKYYDPELETELKVAQTNGMPWVSVGELESRGELALGTGVEVGKMNYGTGLIPFVRTSDIADLEIKRDIRHAVSEKVFQQFVIKAGVERGDVLLVRDGTYLVGSSAIVAPGDEPALICGGIFRLRTRNDASVGPFGLLGAVNHPLVRRQMRAKQFTRDVIDTLGDRVREVLLPSPRSMEWKTTELALKRIFETKGTIKDRIRGVIRQIEPPAPPVLAGRPSWSMR
jgi:hypothetical protein